MIGLGEEVVDHRVAVSPRSHNRAKQAETVGPQNRQVGGSSPFTSFKQLQRFSAPRTLPGGPLA